MKILLNKSDLNEAIKGISNLGFVPTMGALHKGHFSLIKKSKKVCKKTIVSIFVNPTQFNNKKDFIKYPRNLKKDLINLSKLKVNYVFIPKKKIIYETKRKKRLSIKNKEKILCAKFRKGHFEGVIDVMDRLTNLIKPKKIFMGKKDYQQIIFVKKFVEKKYNCKIIPCETVRDKNGMALSSRNLLLSKNNLNKAGNIAKEIINLKSLLKKKKNKKIFLEKKKGQIENFFKIKFEYLELRNQKNLKISNTSKQSKIFISYYLNKVRLIDNF